MGGGDQAAHCRELGRQSGQRALVLVKSSGEALFVNNARL